MKKVFILFFLLFVLLSCGEKNASKESEETSQIKKQNILNVTVSIPPQAYIVNSVGKDKVSVNVMLPPTSAPETYEPGPQRMAELKNSALYFKIGLPFEAASIEHLAKDYKNIRFVEMQKGVTFRKMEGKHRHEGHRHHEEFHSHEGNHEDCPHYKEHHGISDPHIWLDPMNLVVMTDNAVEELSAADPDNASFYRENGEALKNEIRRVSDEVSEQLKDIADKNFVVHHPAFGYFAERFGLKQIPLEIEGKEPSATDMAKIVDFIKQNNVKAIFMQAQIPDSVVKSVAEETKVNIVVLDPLKENALENIQQIAKEIKGVFANEK